MQDLQTLEEIEKIEQSLNNIDLNETIPLEATKTIKKKRVLSEKQLNVLALAREKLKEKTKERQIQKRLEQEAIEDEVQKRLNEYKTGLEQKVVRKAISIKKKKVLSERQLEVLSNARAKLAERNKERIAQKKLEQQAIEDEVQKRLNEYKTGLEQKVVRKAISIKKKQIKKKALLEEISDDETPIQKIKEIAKKKNHPAPQPEPANKFIFV